MTEQDKKNVERARAIWNYIIDTGKNMSFRESSMVSFLAAIVPAVMVFMASVNRKECE